MKKHVFMLILSITFYASCLPASNHTENPTNDASTVDDSPIPCIELGFRWAELTGKEQTCTKDDDCVLVAAGRYNCDCGPGISSSGGNVISRKHIGEAERYIKRYKSEECRKKIGYSCNRMPYHGFANPSCKNGRCAIDMVRCE